MNTKPTTEFLRKITDDFGVWQHTDKGNVLREHGYALDDSARALIVFLMYGDLKEAEVCVNYLEKSLKDGLFIGFFNDKRENIVYPSSHDAHVLGIWALSYATSVNFMTEKCKELLAKIKDDFIYDLLFSRPKAYLLISKVLTKDFDVAGKIADKLRENYISEVKWFEKRLTYANAIFPWSLLSYLSHKKNENENGDSRLVQEIQESIETLERNMRIGVIPAPVGNRKWQDVDDHMKDIYGQQPIDAAFMVLMYVEAYKFFKDEKYKKRAKEWMSWFYGDNIFKESLITEQSACADGIDQKGLSDNYGAESTIVYLWAAKALSEID